MLNDFMWILLACAGAVSGTALAVVLGRLTAYLVEKIK